MDDGSTDQTWKILQAYSRKDPRIKVFSQKNQGVTKTLNTLLDKVTSEYLFYLDSDDYIHPQTLEILLHLMEKHRVDLVECDVERVYDKETAKLAVVHDKSALPVSFVQDMNIYYSKKLAKGHWINKCNKLYRFHRVKSFRFSELLPYEEDYFYALQVATVVAGKVIVHLPFYYYRSNPASATRSVHFERYVDAGIARIGLSYDYFILQDRVPDAYRDVFMSDLAKDAYRMIVRKCQKKCRDKVLRRKLFAKASSAMSDYVRRGIVRLGYLTWLERLAVWFCMRQWYGVSRLLVYLT